MSKDYLGETPVHKAARTGSMECISLLAAHGANLRIPNNNHHSPAQLARMCGYQDCGQYLDSIVTGQDQNKNALVPHIPEESPATKVDNRVITQGLNAGCIPTELVEEHHDMEMDDSEAAGGDGHHINEVNKHRPLVNGFSTHAHPVDGTCDGDITVVPAISENRVPIAGKKRAREEFEDYHIKRPRQGEPVFRNMCNGLPIHLNNVTSVEKQISESVIEHESVLTLQQGYDSMFFDALSSHHMYGEI